MSHNIASYHIALAVCYIYGEVVISAVLPLSIGPTTISPSPVDYDVGSDSSVKGE